MKIDGTTVTTGTNNIFADLGLPNPEERLLKAQLVSHLSSVIQARKLTQKAAAQLLEIDQPKVSQLLRGRLDGFSIERILKFLAALDQDVRIVIAEKPAGQARPAHLLVQSDPQAA